ncbi:MAG TPA: hypothetical protein VFO16_04795 [Pseudonocardiaceae bacterium]|nr:hypothetical protein [Pseudonocardiaceae bacterium]
MFEPLDVVLPVPHGRQPSSAGMPDRQHCPHPLIWWLGPALGANQQATTWQFRGNDILRGTGDTVVIRDDRELLAELAELDWKS